MRKAFSNVPRKYNKSDQFFVFPNDSEVWFGGLDDAYRVEKILGKEYATIYCNETSQFAYSSVVTLRTRLAQSATKIDGRALPLKMYYDLNPTGQGHWTYKEFVRGIRPDNGLPVAEGSRAYLVMNPTDNPELSGEYIEELEALPERARKRFLEGEYSSEVPGSLWSSEAIDRLRRKRPVKELLGRTIVSIDPSGGDGTGNDLQGIMVGAIGHDGHGYLLADRSCKLTPAGWGRRAIDAYYEFGADLMIAEVNYGGAMVENVIKGIDKNVNFKAVTASRGKHIRAEPVAGLCEDTEKHQGLIHHCVDPANPFAANEFAELEDQLVMFTTDGYQGSDSPDRGDAYVWLWTELFLEDGFDLSTYIKAYA
jgi:hypothetical protein